MNIVAHEKDQLMSLPPILQNLELPIVAAPMFIVSGPDLVIAQCKAGVVGSFPALNARPADCLLYTSPSPRDATLSRMPSSA